MKSIQWFSLAFIMLGACNGLKGEMTVESGITLTSGKKEISIQAGSYPSEIIYKKNKRLDIKIKRLDGKRMGTFRFNLPQELDLEALIESPDDSRTFVGSDQNGQNYDLEIVSEKTVEESERYRGWEMCSSLRRVRRCHWEDGRRRCWWDRDYGRGERRVEYFFETTHHTMTCNLHEPGVVETIAVASGERTVTQKVYTYWGICHPH